MDQLLFPRKVELLNLRNTCFLSPDICPWGKLGRELTKSDGYIQKDEYGVGGVGEN